MNHHSKDWTWRAHGSLARVARLCVDEVACLQLSRLWVEALTNKLPHFGFDFVRTELWRRAGLRVGQRSRIKGPLHITGRARFQDALRVGADTFLSGPTHIDLEAPVEIGDHVFLGHEVMLLTVDHRIGEHRQRCAANQARPIRIGDGAWLSSRTTVLPGVSIGRGAVVAAGAVVTRDVPDDCLVAGVPARVIRQLDDDAAPESGEFRADAQANADRSRSPALRALS